MNQVTIIWNWHWDWLPQHLSDPGWVAGPKNYNNARCVSMTGNLLTSTPILAPKKDVAFKVLDV